MGAGAGGRVSRGVAAAVDRGGGGVGQMGAVTASGHSLAENGRPFESRTKLNFKFVELTLLHV